MDAHEAEIRANPRVADRYTPPPEEEIQAGVAQDKKTFEAMKNAAQMKDLQLQQKSLMQRMADREAAKKGYAKSIAALDKLGGTDAIAQAFNGLTSSLTRDSYRDKEALSAVQIALKNASGAKTSTEGGSVQRALFPGEAPGIRDLLVAAYSALRTQRFSSHSCERAALQHFL